MTTEIAVMNKSAIALAADSAVSIAVSGPQGNTHKVLNSANKLFALSKCAPVGLMIYGNASLLGIPWETIVKMYRRHLGDKELSHLTDYCDDFFTYLDQFDVEAGVQERYVINGAVSIFRIIRSHLDRWVAGQVKSNPPVSQEQVEAQLRDIITKEHDEFRKLGEQSVLPEATRSRLATQYTPTLSKAIEEVFEKRPIAEDVRSLLITIAINAASFGPPNQSGIVIAGFGERDLYPRCRSYDVAAVLAGKTIKRNSNSGDITNDCGAHIIPFAQADDVHTFMQGIGPVLGQFLRTTFYTMMTHGVPEALHKEISTKLGLADPQKAEVRKIADEVCKGACDRAFQQLVEQQRISYIDPVVTATGFLNTAELAAMAETLVNLVSFRKQVTMETETVGGPIDVAVITKGDGLVWIRRKHYFPAELNHHFFSNYYRGVRYDGLNEETSDV